MDWSDYSPERGWPRCIYNLHQILRIGEKTAQEFSKGQIWGVTNGIRATMLRRWLWSRSLRRCTPHKPGTFLTTMATHISIIGVPIPQVCVIFHRIEAFPSH